MKACIGVQGPFFSLALFCLCFNHLRDVMVVVVTSGGGGVDDEGE